MDTHANTYSYDDPKRDTHNYPNHHSNQYPYRYPYRDPHRNHNSDPN
jgi:hypothetical protein